MISALEQALASLPESGTSVEPVRRLADLVDGDLPLQGFLEQLLPLLCELFSAPAAVAWMKVQGAVFGVRYRMDAMLPTAVLQRKHEKLVQLAWYQKRPMIAEPSVAAPVEERVDTEVQNPTDHPLLFAPILHMSEPIAFLEVVLQPQHVPLATAQKQIYLRAIQLVAERVYGGLKRRMTMPVAQLSQATRELNNLAVQLQALQTQIQRTIEIKLAQFQGWQFESLTDNQEFARLVHQILDSHGLRVVCPECGNPAILRCLRAGNAKHGVFVYDHYLESGRTFHGGPTTFPALKVVAKPARRTSASPSEE